METSPGLCSWNRMPFWTFVAIVVATCPLLTFSLWMVEHFMISFNILLQWCRGPVFLAHSVQESLANTKVNARQHCVRLSCLCNSLTQIEWVVQLLLPPKHQTTFPPLTVWVYLHSFSCCSVPNTRNHAKFQENSTFQQFKVIQGHRSWCQSKAHMRLPISH